MQVTAPRSLSKRHERSLSRRPLNQGVSRPYGKTHECLSCLYPLKDRPRTGASSMDVSVVFLNDDARRCLVNLSRLSRTPINGGKNNHAAAAGAADPPFASTVPGVPKRPTVSRGDRKKLFLLRAPKLPRNDATRKSSAGEANPDPNPDALHKPLTGTTTRSRSEHTRRRTQGKTRASSRQRPLPPRRDLLYRLLVIPPDACAVACMKSSSVMTSRNSR